MLATVQGDHLTGYGFTCKQEADGLANFGRRGAAPEGQLRHGIVEFRLAAASLGKGEARPDAVDPDAWGKRHRQALGEGP
jgi:hypothetical protein